jgi:hypothetical protein
MCSLTQGREAFRGFATKKAKSRGPKGGGIADLRWFDIMKNTPAESKYVTLVADIGRLYEGAQKALVDAYWRIGRRIVEMDQDGADRAEYGGGLLERLSVDLSDRYGTGFSVDNLERMRRFYLRMQIPRRRGNWGGRSMLSCCRWMTIRPGASWRVVRKRMD